MTTAPGYDRPLYILPFDHRGTFLAKMLGAKGPSCAAMVTVKVAVCPAETVAARGATASEKLVTVT